MSFYTINWAPVFVGHNTCKNKSTQSKQRYYNSSSSSSMAIQFCSALVQTNESGNSKESNNKISRSCTNNCLLSRSNSIGIIGGVSVFSTLIFLEKLVWWSSRGGKECMPFIVSSDPFQTSSLSNSRNYVKSHEMMMMIDNLRCKRAFLEQSGARCIVMPCFTYHLWYHEVSKGCSVPFLDAADCVARELKEANLKPTEAGSRVRIGVLGAESDGISFAGDFYQEKLLNQGFELVLPDKATMEHTIIPAIEALNRKDMEGAQNLLRIAIQVFMVKSVNKVIIASDKFQGLLPSNDPLLKKCINPMDALARSAVKWAQSTSKVN